MVFGFRSSTRAPAAADTTAANTSTPPAPAHTRWLKGYHSRNEQKHVGNLKAKLNDSNTTTAERGQAKTELNAMGRGKEAHVPISVRVKSMFQSNKGANINTRATTAPA
ncbi:hypothetical protein CTheo_1650 [Ceratobasidium theobromae]|uniref:Uncharacterized protein n=1 Tax=Ceratobasidium theobromae TaxID=1582974 RepID=A0A5N5QSV8_9AGAM|nr:hypothetical protein CTheo_1650 [Ceratobasidium theobromae]